MFRAWGLGLSVLFGFCFLKRPFLLGVWGGVQVDGLGLGV